ncbi:hypothetical protein EV14_2246 [Prochlorococcus sp. MIT 0703]|nr:hypothetical protein EV14_2246 [Prochlorococcus sp. MIT 0703]
MLQRWILLILNSPCLSEIKKLLLSRENLMLKSPILNLSWPTKVNTGKPKIISSNISSGLMIPHRFIEPLSLAYP